MNKTFKAIEKSLVLIEVLKLSEKEILKNSILREYLLTVSPKEVEELPLEEKKKYYQIYRSLVLKRKLTNTTPGATTIAPLLKNLTGIICQYVSKAFTTPNLKNESEGLENIPEGPVIFAHTHQGILDNFIWNYDLKKHGLILHNSDVNKALLFAQLNTGLVLVDRNDKISRKNSKLDMVKLLLKGYSMHYFPEGTWNLSPNRLHLPMSFGIIDTAKKARVPIVPVAHEYIYEEIDGKTIITEAYTVYDKPIYVSETDNIYDKLEELSASFSTMKFSFMKKRGQFKRNNVSNEEYVNFLKANNSEMEFGQVQTQSESSNIFGSKEFFYQVCPPNEVPCSKDENGDWFLDTTPQRKQLGDDLPTYSQNSISKKRILRSNSKK